MVDRVKAESGPQATQKRTGPLSWTQKGAVHLILSCDLQSQITE